MATREGDAGDSPGPSRRAAEVAALLHRATTRSVRGRSPLTLLFSGGLDSSLLAWIARDVPGIQLVTVGRPGSPDLVAGESAASLIGVPWRGIPIDDAALRAGIDRWSGTLQPLPEPRRSVLWTLGIAFLHCEGPYLLLGQGADELFGGYAHFDGLSVADAVRRSESDWQRLQDEDWPRTEALARELGVELGSPYLDEEFSGFVRALPPWDRGLGGARKSLLRDAARILGLPKALVLRPKRAMQYGTRLARDLGRFSAFETAASPRALASPPRPAAPDSGTAHR